MFVYILLHIYLKNIARLTRNLVSSLYIFFYIINDFFFFRKKKKNLYKVTKIFRIIFKNIYIANIDVVSFKL